MATEAKIIFNKNPPHNVGFGPSAISNKQKIKGTRNIHRIIKNLLNLWMIGVLEIYLVKKYEKAEIKSVMITLKIDDSVVKIKHRIITIKEINANSFLDGDTKDLRDENIKNEDIHNILQALHSSSCGILPINNSLLFSVTTAHSELDINPSKLLIRKKSNTILKVEITVLNTDPENVLNIHFNF
jgi:hypothetical protein